MIHLLNMCFINTSHCIVASVPGSFMVPLFLCDIFGRSEGLWIEMCYLRYYRQVRDCQSLLDHYFEKNCEFSSRQRVYCLHILWRVSWASPNFGIHVYSLAGIVFELSVLRSVVLGWLSLESFLVFDKHTHTYTKLNKNLNSTVNCLFTHHTFVKLTVYEAQFQALVIQHYTKALSFGKAHPSDGDRR